MITIDAHLDVPWIMTKHGPFDLVNGAAASMVSFDKLARGGLNAAFFALYLSEGLQDDYGPIAVDEAIAWQIDVLKAQEHADIVDHPVLAYDTIVNGKFPIFLGLESGRLIHNSKRRLADLRKEGVRYMTLTHNKNTDWADSATDKPKHGGVTAFGRQILEVCEKLGVLIDVSHTSWQTTRDVLDLASKPVIASHSGCATITPHPRNLSDDHICTIAKLGGVVCIPFARRFVGPGIRDVFRHIDHAMMLVGPKHVGIGSDIDGAELVAGVTDVADWRTVAIDQLASSGYSARDVECISGGNLERILEETYV